MDSLGGIFNNREIALGIWAIVFFVWAFMQVDRKPFKELLLSFLQKPIIISLILMAAYIGLVVRLLYELGFWDTSNLKDTVLWVFASAFVMLLNTPSVSKERFYFRKVILDNITLIIILEFVINLYVFDLWFEMILVPTIFILSVFTAVAETNSLYKRVANLIFVLLALIGIGQIVYASVSAFGDFSNLFTLETLHSLLLTSILTVTFLPFIYLAALYSQYEQILVRMKIYKNEPRLIQEAMWKIFIKFNLDLDRLIQWSKSIRVLKFRNKEEIAEMLKSKPIVGTTRG